MRDLVQEILEAEKRAEELLQHAREKAAGIKTQADAEVKAKIAEARAKAQGLVGRSVRQIRLEAEEIRKKRIEEAEVKSRALASRSDVSLDDLADEVAQMIIETELE
jgi:vacuolar-type H+-ATPase subunit H